MPNLIFYNDPVALIKPNITTMHTYKKKMQKDTKLNIV